MCVSVCVNKGSVVVVTHKHTELLHNSSALSGGGLCSSVGLMRSSEPPADC